jgi:hypothetical protein
VGPVAAAAAVAAAALANLGNLTTHKDENGGLGAFVGCAIVALIIAALLFGWALPRWQESRRAPLVLTALAAVSLGAFWAGLPEVVAPAAIMAALSVPERTTGHKVAIGVSTLVLVAGVVAALVG